MIYNIRVLNYDFINAVYIQSMYEDIKIVELSNTAIMVQTNDNDVINNTNRLITPNEYFKDYYKNRESLNYDVVKDLLYSNNNDNIVVAFHLIATSNLYDSPNLSLCTPIINKNILLNSYLQLNFAYFDSLIQIINKYKNGIYN